MASSLSARNTEDTGTATLFGLTVLENMRYDSDNNRRSKLLIFDAQFVTKSGQTIVAALRFWNQDNIKFSAAENGVIGKYVVLATVSTISIYFIHHSLTDTLQITRMAPSGNVRSTVLDITEYALVGDIHWVCIAVACFSFHVLIS